MKFMRLLMFGTVMLMANGAGAQNSVKPFHLDEATISDVHAAYKSGALTSVRLVQAYLERIRACDQAGPKLNVVIFLNPRALEEAAATNGLVTQLLRAGALRLHAGQPLSQGSFLVQSLLPPRGSK